VDIIVVARGASTEDFDALASDLEGSAPGLRVVGVRHDTTLKMMTFWEVVRVFIPDHVASAVTDAMLVALIHWFRERFKRGVGRPQKYGAIYGPDGRVVKSFLLKNPDDEPEDKTEHDKDILLKPPPLE
jgi:hypothetical protein